MDCKEINTRHFHCMSSLVSHSAELWGVRERLFRVQVFQGDCLSGRKGLEIPRTVLSVLPCWFWGVFLLAMCESVCCGSLVTRAVPAAPRAPQCRTGHLIKAHRTFSLQFDSFCVCCVHTRMEEVNLHA